MDKLPTEIIINIFSFLPLRFVLLATTLSKLYYNILLHPLLFKTLHIYSLQQYEKCLMMGKNRRLKINHRCLNYYFEHINFHNSLGNDQFYITKIVKVFPNVHSIHFQDLYSNLYFSIFTIKQLDHFHFWYTNAQSHWVKSILYKQHKLKTLEFRVTSPGIKYYIHTTPIDSEKEIYPSSTLKYNQHILKIHTIAFPVFYVLTDLSIDGSKCEMDEVFIESIHKFAPQLTFLTLKLFTMTITDDHFGNGNTIIHDKPPLKPNNQLKKLDISAIFCDIRCYKYLSFKFPFIESLSLQLPEENNPNESFKLAIYDTITQYRHLKKLEIHSSSYNIWPAIDLLRWIQQNPAQLTHLYYPFNLLINNNNNNNQQQKQQKIELNTTYDDQHLYLKHNYFNYLSSLSLYLEDQIDMLSYFFLYNSTNMYNSIKELNIKSEKSISIYLWLNLFPNLRSLNIEGISSNEMGDINDKDDNDDYGNSRNNQRVKKLYRSSGQKMDQQKQVNNETPTIYKLRKINVNTYMIDFKKHGLNEFFKRCPSLKTIILNHINCTNYSTLNGDKPFQQATFDLSYLSLSLLYFRHFYFTTSNYININNNCQSVKELLINETSLDKKYYLGIGNITQNESFNYNYSTTLCITCKSIDHIVFN